MKAVKIILNVLGIILSFVLSVVLVVMLLAAPVISMASSVVKPETVKEIIMNIDFIELLKPSTNQTDYIQDELQQFDDINYSATNTGRLPTDTYKVANMTLSADAGNAVVNGLQDKVNEKLDENELTVNIIEKVIESEAFDEILNLVSDDVVAIINGESSELQVTTDRLNQIVSENVDSIAESIYEFVEDKESVALDDVKEAILSETDNFAPAVVDALNDVKESIAENAGNEVVGVLKAVTNGTLKAVLITAIIVCSLLIFLLRFPKFKGLMWLGVVYAVGALFMLATFALSDFALAELLGGNTANGSMSFLTPVIDMIVANFGYTAIIYFVIAAVAIAGFITATILIKKKNQQPLQVEAATEQPQEITEFSVK